MIRKTIHRILTMNGPAWRALLVSLKTAVLFLLVSLICLFRCQESGELDQLRMAYIFQELSQLSFLSAALLPVCLEELIGADQKNPPGSSGR